MDIRHFSGIDYAPTGQRRDRAMTSLPVLRYWTLRPGSAADHLGRQPGDGSAAGVAAVLAGSQVDFGDLEAFYRAGYAVVDIPAALRDADDADILAYAQAGAPAAPVAGAARRSHADEAAADIDQHAPGDLSDDELDAYVDWMNDPDRDDAEVPY